MPPYYTHFHSVSAVWRAATSTRTSQTHTHTHWHKFVRTADPAPTITHTFAKRAYYYSRKKKIRTTSFYLHITHDAISALVSSTASIPRTSRPPPITANRHPNNNIATNRETENGDLLEDVCRRSTAGVVIAVIVISPSAFPQRPGAEQRPTQPKSHQTHWGKLHKCVWPNIVDFDARRQA